jgi:hypothetical protein
MRNNNQQTAHAPLQAFDRVLCPKNRNYDQPSMNTAKICGVHLEGISFWICGIPPCGFSAELREDVNPDANQRGRSQKDVDCD